MRYIVEARFWERGEDFHVCDHDGRPVFRVEGMAFSWGDKLSFQDLKQQELAFISQKLLSWMPRFRIYRDGTLVVEVLKESSWHRRRFTLDLPGPSAYSIDGSFWLHDYRFRRHGRVVARVGMTRAPRADTYGVEIEAGEDDVSILCAAIVVDEVLHDGHYA